MARKYTHFLGQDRFKTLYLIPIERRAEWEAYRSLPERDPITQRPPSLSVARPVTVPLEKLIFDHPRVDTFSGDEGPSPLLS